MPGARDRVELVGLAGRMADTLAHRGPDSAGTWVDAAAGVALGHRRLSIIDLSPAGHQPMVSASGRLVISFNGELYNFRELRRDLEAAGTVFRGGSDTEVLLEAIARWGLETALGRADGMFALAVWDREARRLWLARDRLGEKPLYYGRAGPGWVFGSELKALRAHPDYRARIDRDSLVLFLRHGYVPSPHCILADTHQLPPGTYLALGPETRTPAPTAYWSLREAVLQGAARPFAGGDAEAVDELERLLGEAVSERMVADVPLGALLSGGIDSSTVVALMQARSGRPVRTFSVGYRESTYNEAQHARRVAAHLGTDHTELYVEPRDALALIPELPYAYDEPFADASQIPTSLICRLTREHVTVALSGDGGDELFGGYNRYTWARNIWGSLGWLPVGVRRLVGRALTRVSPQAWDRVFAGLGRLSARLRDQRMPGDRMHKLASVIPSEGPRELYRALVSQWSRPAELVRGGLEPPGIEAVEAAMPPLSDLSERMMYLDTLSYLPGDILVKLDRASMGVALETRVPFLDHRVVEFAWRLPVHLRVRGGEGKWLLRRVLDRHVPRALVDRPKMGFAVPIDAWLRGPLRDWAEALLDPARLAREGYLEPAPVLARWHEHLSGRRNWQYAIWTVLMFQAWLERWGTGLRPEPVSPRG